MEKFDDLPYPIVVFLTLTKTHRINSINFTVINEWGLL